MGTLLLLVAALAGFAPPPPDAGRPNVVLIYADDLGYGDLGAYGATRVATPHIDGLAAAGLRFSNAHAAAATCTPSRYALLTGEYAWRRKGTGVLPGDASLIVAPGRTTLASLLKRAGYRTGVVGKWHLGLGEGPIDWNREIRPGPREIGFDESFIIPATGDRVPCVFVENGRVRGLDPKDPIEVSYQHPVGDEPTGRAHPELLRMHPSAGHDQTIVNGISRIGYMKGGRSARWVDEDVADVLTTTACAFVERHRHEPFFLYFASHDIHVPRVPHPRFAGRSGLGPRGDVILQLDSSAGAILDTLRRLRLDEKTLVVFTSDNGPVVDDGYRDEAREKLGGHRPSGPLRGGKYSAFDGGTRVPLIVRWPGRVKPGVSDALVDQVDFLASFAALTGQRLAADDGPDSFDVLAALLGRSQTGRESVVEQAGALSLVAGKWKLIAPHAGRKVDPETEIELGNDKEPQLYDLSADLGEQRNVASEHPDVVRELSARLARMRQDGRTRPAEAPRLARLPEALRAEGQALLEQTAEAQRAEQADRLARSDPAGAMEFLLELLEQEPSAVVRRAIVNRLGRHSDPAVRRALERVGASDPDARVSILAVERLRVQQTAAVRAVMEQRLTAAQAKGDAEQAALLVRELQRWGPLVRGTMLPDFMQSPPPVFSVPAAPPLRVLAFGDYGSGSADQRRVAAAITRSHRQKPFSFAVSVGDNFLDQGITGLTDPRWRTDWEDLYSPLGIPFFATLGNHDWGHAGSPAAQVAYTLASPSWRMPAVYYTFVAGPAQFFALETNDLGEAQLAWLKDQLERSTAAWKIVYGHHPIYSAGTHGDTPDLVRRLLPILRDRAQVYLAGHDHDIQHLKPEGGVSFFVTGTAGVSLRPPKPDQRSLFADAVWGFTSLEIDADHLRVTFLDCDLKPLYEHTLGR